jgi:hypothetical protein
MGLHITPNGRDAIISVCRTRAETSPQQLFIGAVNSGYLKFAQRDPWVGLFGLTYDIISNFSPEVILQLQEPVNLYCEDGFILVSLASLLMFCYSEENENLEIGRGDDVFITASESPFDA